MRCARAERLIGIDVRLSTEGMRGDKLAGLGVHPADVVLEFGCLDAPLAPASDLDCREVATPDEGVGLCGRDVQGFGDICEGEKARGHLLMVPNRLPCMATAPEPVDNFLAMRRGWAILGRHQGTHERAGSVPCHQPSNGESP